uniref:Uncharacterized protein n=1 Tax=Physcomitrium patens TaxID=3218 RepID=A9RHR9_PHYPA|nr:hypothetical protein PHYPA_027735 [Physcomitrium patens]
MPGCPSSRHPRSPVPQDPSESWEKASPVAGHQLEPENSIGNVWEHVHFEEEKQGIASPRHDHSTRNQGWNLISSAPFNSTSSCEAVSMIHIENCRGWVLHSRCN